MRLVHSQSIIKHAIKIMNYTSTVQTFEGFWISLSCVSNTKSELKRSSTPWLRLVVLGIAHGGQEGALFALSQLFSILYR